MNYRCPLPPHPYLVESLLPPLPAVLEPAGQPLLPTINTLPTEGLQTHTHKQNRSTHFLLQACRHTKSTSLCVSYTHVVQNCISGDHSLIALQPDSVCTGGQGYNSSIKDTFRPKYSVTSTYMYIRNTAKFDG